MIRSRNGSPGQVLDDASQPAGTRRPDDVTGAGDGHNDTARALAEALPHGRYMMVPGDHLTVSIAGLADLDIMIGPDAK